MDEEARTEHYENPGTYRNPKTGKLVTPAVKTGSSKQARRIKHKANHAIAIQVRAAEAKVARLRGAAKKSAQTTLDKLRATFKFN